MGKPLVYKHRLFEHRIVASEKLLDNTFKTPKFGLSIYRGLPLQELIAESPFIFTADNFPHFHRKPVL
jgi:hypothetical protein